MHGFLSELNDDVVGVARVTKIKMSLWSWISKRPFIVLPSEYWGVFVRGLGFVLSNMIPFLSKKRYTVKSVLKEFNQEFIDVEYNINKKRYLDWIRAKKPDLIVCFSFLIFKKELLEIPSLGCINRHSAALPSYAGVFPVFNMVKNAEKEAGATIHYMTEVIDDGDILGQVKYPIDNTQSVDELYIENFKYCLKLVLEVIEKIRHNNVYAIKNNEIPSYNTFPTDEDVKEFRARGGRFI